jgi:hypothetical protein
MSNDSAMQTPPDSGTTAFVKLRGILLGPEQEEIRQLKRRLESAHGAEDISRALPDAVRLAAQRNHKLRAAMQPLIEQSIRLSVLRDPSILSDSLAPLIGDAVKKAVGSAFRELAHSLNQTIEQLLTWRSLHWRFEALQTGKGYREIALLRSQLYQVQEVFLIHRDTGLLLVQRAAESNISKDADLVAPMLTAIQDFVKDSFEGRAVDSLDSVEAGEFVIWVQNSPRAILAGIIRGAPPRALKGV